MICYLLKSIYVFLLLLFAGALSYSDAFGQEKQIKKLFSELGIESLAGQKAPAFALTTLTGDSISLAQFRGKLLILHFWATWCKPCRKEMPDLQKFSRQITSLPVAIAGVAIDEKSARAKIVVALQELGVQYPNAAAFSGTISDAYWTWGIPATYFIGPDGKFIGRIRGTRNWTDGKMFAFLQRLLSDSRIGVKE